jgi:uncharacterized coiled-coil protein SlyX
MDVLQKLKEDYKKLFDQRLDTLDIRAFAQEQKKIEELGERIIALESNMASTRQGIREHQRY